MLVGQAPLRREAIHGQVGQWPPLVAVPPPADSGIVDGTASELSAADLTRVWAAVDASTSANTKAAYRSD